MTKKDEQDFSPYDLFGTNQDLESGSGVDLEYPGFTITIHRAGGSNENYSKALSRRMKPHRRRYENGTLDDNTSAKILLESFAEGVVVGWKGVKGRDGKAMAFNHANVVKLFTDLPDLYTDVRGQAMSAATFREEAEEADEKN